MLTIQNYASLKCILWYMFYCDCHAALGGQFFVKLFTFENISHVGEMTVAM